MSIVIRGAPKLSVISIIKVWFISLFTKADEPCPKYVDLAPTDKADEAGIYSGALMYAASNANVSNIALTGPYGSGKSSIIKAFLNKYKKEYLQISLAAFLPEADGSVTTDDTSQKTAQKSTVSKQEIERSILQQMLYGADANRLPLSRFKRIQSPKWWSWIVPILIIFGTFSCWYLFKKTDDILSGDFFKPLEYKNWLNFTTFFVGIIFIWKVLHYIYIRSLGVSLKSVSLKDIEITPDNEKDDSILNRHLDEIIYFFQSTKYELVIIEDLDRFNNPEIFVTLREINSLINANAGVKRQIRFLYALRDNMFANTDRTKFFEFIIPVIPIINSSNSIDKVIEQGQRLSLDSRLDRQFLREVSRYLNDLRLIRNIFNEYAIFVANLETDGENILNANKLLAILIYKNVLPSDFEELHREKGKLWNILHQRDKLIATAEARYKNQILELEQQISNAERQVPSDLRELRRIYAMALVDMLPHGWSFIDFNEHRNTPIQNIWDHQDFENLIEMPNILCRAQPQYSSQRIDIRNLQKEVNSEKTYSERKAEIERKSGEFKDIASKSIREIRGKTGALRTTKFNEIIRTNAQTIEALFSAFGENRDLVKFLVFEGFLDDTYYQYTSLFHSHSGRLSPNDNKFLIQIRSFSNPEPDFQIDNPKEVIIAMREDDFRQHFGLNKTLIDCIFSNKGAYGPQITKLIGFISANFADCGQFFTTYYESGKCVDELISTLVLKWPAFVTNAISSPDNVSHIAQMIAHLPEEYLETLPQKEPRITGFLEENLSDILALKIDFEPRRLALFNFEVKKIKSIKPYPAIARLLSNRGLYEITTENIEYIFQDIFGLNSVKDLRTKHYSTLLKTGNVDLIEKVQANFDHYLRKVLLSSENNTEEEVSVIIDVINRDNIESEYLEQFIEKQSANFPSLEQIPNRIHSVVFRLRKIEATWANCIAYIVSENFDANILTAYLHHHDIQSRLKTTTIDDQKSFQPLRQFLVNNSDFDDNTYRTYIKTLPKQFTKFPDGVGSEKLRILIEEKAVVFSYENFSALEEEDLQVLFIVKNVDIYFSNIEKFNLDDKFITQLLISELGDDKKLKVIEHMNLSSITQLPHLASLIGQIFYRNAVDVSHLDAEVVQSLIVNTKPIAAQISLFNKCHKTLSVEQLWTTLQKLPKPFSQILRGGGQPTIPNTPENLEFVRWLTMRSIISSSKLTFFEDAIRIFNFRK